jgi:hypothetical protein
MPHKIFYQFGFRKMGESGNHIFGKCCFCGKDKFYINKETKAWDCKSASCNSKGGIFTLLGLVYKRMCLKHDNLFKLAQHRGFKKETLIRNNIGFNPSTEMYLIPQKTYDKKEILNIIHYNLEEKTPKASSGISIGMFGWENIKPEHKNIWLMEGIWDWLAMDEIFYRLRKKEDVAIGSPGAMTFKEDWVHLFKNKNVICCYDKDKAGMDGCEKVKRLLLSSVSSLAFLHWPNSKKEGYDLRDFYNDNYNDTSKTIKTIKTYLRTTTPNYYGDIHEITQDENESIIDKIETKKIKNYDYEDVYKTYKKWLYLQNTDCIDILFGTILANMFEGDPIWIFFVAPPGGTKSELINSITESSKIEALSNLNNHTLVSGMRLEGGGDPSLLPRLNNRILAINDFTVILSLNKIYRDEILGILRDAYGGTYNHIFGNNQSRKYISKFGIIAGVTPVIEGFIDDHVALGERFLRYNMSIDNTIAGRKKFIQKALDNSMQEDHMRKELKRVAIAVIEHKGYKCNKIDLSKDLSNKILCIAQLTSMMRGIVTRDRYSKEVIQKPFIELGTRLAKQFCKLIHGILLFKNKNSEKEILNCYEIIKKIAISSVPSRIESVLKIMYKMDKGNYSIGDICEVIKFPSITVNRILEDMTLLGLTNKEKTSLMKQSYFIKEDTLDLIKESKIYD